MLDLFTEQVLEGPARIAVSSGKIHISYLELDKETDQIAMWLVEHNVGPEDIVAVDMERGHQLVLSLIGILKAGAAYLALDVDTPRFRRDRLIADAGAIALVTSSDGLQHVSLPTLRLPDGLNRQRRGNHLTAKSPRPEGLAYVCYTSGSTGRPKGVGVPHRAVVRLVSGDYVKLGPGQTFLWLSPISFDASTFEIWGPLLTGGRLVIHPSGPLDVEELAAVLYEEKVTTLFLTTALFHRVVEHKLDALSSLKQLLTGGEVLNPEYFNLVIDRLPNTQLFAAYGPTENTTFTTCHKVSGPNGKSWVPIGCPITGTTIYILDSSLEPVHVGSNGELWVSGLGLSRGYLGQPKATALKFVPDPFGNAGSRMYRTGDIVRQDPSGDLEFIGREDRQVKIRGFRIEPEEIEREISTIFGVQEAVVVPHRYHLAEKRLTAYLVHDHGDNDQETLIARVRRSLRGTLPSTMIPVTFITMDQLPITTNGKLDRATLPVPVRAARQIDTDFVAPRSPTEQLLCDMWAELLKLNLVGAVDDFFELGGHSLLAMDLMSQTETVFDVELPVRALLLHPTVEEFACAIDKLVDDRNSPI